MRGNFCYRVGMSKSAKPLSVCLATVDTPQGRKRTARYLASQPFPHYEPAGDSPGLLVRIAADGKRTTGRFVNREFVAVKAKAARR